MTEDQRKEIMDVVLFGYELQEVIRKAEADGVVNWKDAQYLPSVGPSLYAAVKGFDAIPEGFKNLTEEDRVWVVESVKEKFDINDDRLEERVEDLFDWALHTVLVVKRSIL